MGVTTEYLGRIDVVPALNLAEQNYLLAFSRSRRCWRSDGGYAVEPPQPRDEDRPSASVDLAGYNASVDRFNRIAEGQPSLHCQWVPCPQGCCLGWDGREKFYNGPRWMQFLIEHFLRPDAHAQVSGDPQFAAFTFDHLANGVVAGFQQDNRELFLLWVANNEVRLETLCPGDPSPWVIPAPLGQKPRESRRPDR